MIASSIALLANGIEPMVTLYHWDLPAALDDLGGCSIPRSRSGLPTTLGDVSGSSTAGFRCGATLNEPWVITDGGYLYGALARAIRSRFEAPIASHNLLRSHAEAVKFYRAEGRHRIGSS